MDQEKRPAYAKQLIEKLNYMTLATAALEGQPWNSPVYYVYDGDVTFYWISRRNTQHSQNIAKNPKAFIVIYDSTVEPYRGEALYAQVVCAEVSDTTEITRALDLTTARIGKANFAPADVQGAAEFRLYKAVVQQAWVKNLEKDVREEVQLGTSLAG